MSKTKIYEIKDDKEIMDEIHREIEERGNPLTEEMVGTAIGAQALKIWMLRRKNPKSVSRVDYTIIDALEKCIPQEPRWAPGNYRIRYTDSYVCPRCGGNFRKTGLADFCYHCGQAIKWPALDEIMSQIESEQGGKE